MIRTRRPSAGPCAGTTRCSGTESAIRPPIVLATSATTPRSRPLPWSLIPPSIGRATEAPRTPWHKTVIYEAHVKGFTKRHPDVPSELQGTYAALALPAVIEHLTRLGITAIELMPVHHAADDRHLLDRGLSNYWGYNTLCFFAPERSYASTQRAGQSVVEFKTMVRALHAAGIEVILDVVYNHTAEGNHLGPTVSFRGIDNRAYYRLVEKDRRHYMDFTGCGNTLNVRHPRVLQLVMDSLRYWAVEMHVDGSLAAGREHLIRTCIWWGARLTERRYAWGLLRRRR